MKSITIKKPFGKVITLLRGAKAQDVMLINETSPAMVRYLGSDNRFRTIQLSEIDDITEIKLTKSDDPEKVLTELHDFILKCEGKEPEAKVTARVRAKKLKKAQEEAIAHRKALGTPEPKEEKKVAEPKATKKKAKAPTKRKKATKKPKASKKAKKSKK